jgi:hypothetical protein
MKSKLSASVKSHSPAPIWNFGDIPKLQLIIDEKSALSTSFLLALDMPARRSSGACKKGRRACTWLREGPAKQELEEHG